MTFSNTASSNSPTANPLTAQSQLRLKNAFNSKCKSLPQPSELSQQQQLEVPQQRTSMRDFIMMEMTRYNSGQMDWNNADIYRLPTKPAENGMTRKDLEYWKHAEEESKKLKANMTDEQKQLLANLDKLFPMSKLEDA